MHYISMDARISSYNSFHGYDARRLKGFIMSSNHSGLSLEMKTIGEREGFNVFGIVQEEGASPYLSAVKPPSLHKTLKMWAQDIYTILSNGNYLSEKTDEFSQSLGKFFGLQADSIQTCARKAGKYSDLNDELKNLYADYHNSARMYDIDRVSREISELEHSTHIPGGNIFIIKGDKGEEVIVGEEELEKYSVDKIKKIYGANKVTVLPAMDYHLDLFIRPLDNKRILLTDDKLMLNVLEKIKEKAKEYGGFKGFMLKMSTKNLIANQKWANKKNIYKNTDEIAEILSSAGYEVIRVPGRIYDVVRDEYSNTSHLIYDCNYLNANVLKNKDGDIVYITNQSLVDKYLGINPKVENKIKYSVRQAFIDAISPYVKREHIYFVSGENNYLPEVMLPRLLGGIHCLCAEVPQVNISQK